MSQDYPRDIVPMAAATKDWTIIPLIMGNALMGIPVMILGASLTHDLGVRGAVIASAAGGAILAIISMLTAYAGARSRRSTALLAEHTFGTLGAVALNAALALALLGWLSVELGFIGQLAAGSVAAAFGIAVPVWLGTTAAAIVIAAICLNGIALIGRTSRWMMPVLAAMVVAVLVLAWRHAGNIAPGSGAKLPLGTGIAAVVGAQMVGVTIMPDYSRFIGSPRGAAVGGAVTNGLLYVAVLSIYAFAGAVAGDADPTNILIAIGVPAVVTLLLPFGLLQNGILCLYSSSLATSTIVRPVSQRWIVTAVAVCGFALAAAGAANWFVPFLVFLGILFPPAAVTMALAGLAAPSTTRDIVRWHGPRVAAWAIGVAVGALGQWGGIAVTGIAAVDAALAAALAVILYSLIRSRRDHAAA